MSEKVSTLTLRLTAEEAAQLEILKTLVHKSTGSEAIKYIVREYPRFCTHYRAEAKRWKEQEAKYQEQERETKKLAEAVQVLVGFAGNMIAESASGSSPAAGK